MEETATAAMAVAPSEPSTEIPNPQLPTVSSKIREEGELSSSSDDGKSKLPPKFSPCTNHVDSDENLVISFCGHDRGSDLEPKRNASRLGSNIKRHSSSLEKSNKLEQSARNAPKAMPEKVPLSHTFISSISKVGGSNNKGAGSMLLGQGSRARNFNPMNKKLANQECGRDQGMISNDNKLQDLRHKIALRESELKLKAAQQLKESASIPDRDHNAVKLKNDAARKYTLVCSEAAQLEPKEPDTKRFKLSTSYGTPQAVGSQQEVAAKKSISLSTDSTWESCHPQERNKVDHSQKEIPLGRRESTIIRPQRQPDKHVGNSLQNMPCRSTDGDVNYGRNQTEKSSRLLDPSIAFNKNAMPANMISNSVPKNFEALSNAVLSNHNGNANVLEHRRSMDLQSFFGMEELIDKELEEAQEHRHKCEIEERNALKVYLKSQRSLLEANARCTNLYHKRELYATKVRSLILNNSTFSWSSEQHQHLEMGLDYLPRHGYEIPTSSCQRQAECNDTNNPSFDSNNQGINNGCSNTFYHRMNGANLGSEPGIEPDASTSEPLPQRGNTADGGYSPSGELDTSGNENEEMSPDGHVSTHLGVENHRNKDTMVKLMDIDTASNAKLSTDSPQDPLVLEATLRSELFARLGTRAMNSKIPCNNTEPAVELGAENEVGSGKSQVHHCVVPLSTAEDNDLKGIERHERSICLYSNETQTQHNIGENSLNSNYSAASGDQGGIPRQGHYSTNTINISPLIFRSAFSHLKKMLPFNSNKFLSKNISIHANDGENENATCLTSDETKWNNMLVNSMPVTVGNLLSEESSYSCSPAVDPFWPLCMFELRGKCNNDECPWQHVNDYGDGNVCKRQRTGSNNPDHLGRLQMHQQNSNGMTKVPKCRNSTILPTYIVDLDTLKGDQFGYKPVVAHGNAQGWQKCFSITITTSNLLQNGLPTDGPLLDGGAERIEVHRAWSKHLSSFQWRSGAGNQIKQAISDGGQAVEMALLILNQETNTLQGVRKALSVLSKALETDPTSVVLWVVYLLICYANLKPNEKDDMFFFAVKNCEVSYVLWLMYINSQKKIDDRLAAYDAAFSVLCQHVSAAPKDRMHESACILDLFLQMSACLCMSGNVEKAIEISRGVFASATKSDEPHPHHLQLSDILNCLTISDKCVFWICCVYLVIYRKLPDAVVHKFECEKHLLDIEWPFVSLSEDDKEMAVKLVETAVESVGSYVYNESVKSELDLRSAQLFALNHIRSMVALDNIDCLRNLLDKYVKLYPSCLELVLVSARVKKHEIGVDSFMGFEEAINMWPNEAPGIQCIWNQYIENAIQNQRIDLAKEITAHWFHNVWQTQHLPNVRMDATDGGNSCGSLGLNSKSVPETSSPDLNLIDAVFGFLNLSLYNIFQNDETEACIAVDKARNAAMFGGLEQCLTKHIMFLLCDALSLKEGGINGAIKKVLEGYMDCSSQASLVPKALTRKFLENIKKPRVQNLISKILSPVSFDCSLLNMILQSWYGSSLLPQTGSDPKHLVDLVEAILKVVPHNFQLAINVCKLLSKSYNSSDRHSAGLWFWGCSTLVNAILDAIPIPPEFIWVEAGGFLQNAMGIEAISERFYKRALSVYPFSIMLWKCFYNLHKTIGDAKDVIEAAKERGIDLVTDSVSGC
ncbi:PREDICTED: uncharacterized protein LOC109329917 isoform X2 [Lupinus angustifolius]|uniref:uncharacterized protein LOC109329917 isoform X2 n=1 Tax=Lupinus angustifolius TaxID=3871 RepID=UPI00092F5E91|nr:PREDICTED: uncharacterized protein LOC109329917 isoform X2 [Lupinus angustifolius]